ncbi:hypothetical protein LTR62_002795 [Meristemomyces frigidus]|uniref:2-dehydropantoate 2-reductase n=1 Tax=Meristemomyces frigidus TaxID=1508187 RepID=A0AAN7YSJ2_9PEZI|nr:hypothetical protein LTR62_002795 [Meristemomyces frigidus]
MPTRVLIIGAGAIGAFYGSRLATAPHTLVSALCRSNYTAVKTHGFQVTSPIYGSTTFRPERVFENVLEAQRSGLRFDFLLVATKALPDVDDDSRLLEGLVGSQTSIVLVQNGVGIEESYQKRSPRTSIITAVAYANAAQPQPGVINHHAWTRMAVGPYRGAKDVDVEGNDESLSMQSCSRFFELLKAGGVKDAELHDAASIQHVRWSKLAINASMNCSAVLSGSSDNYTMTHDPDLVGHLLAVMHEVLDAAPIILGSLPPKSLPTPAQIMKASQRSVSGSKPSMLVDWESGRAMELEVILGNPLRIAREKGVVMPRVESMYALLKLMQRNRDRASGNFSKL